jgi:DNA helicase TIP49 (TBP-interacting protein)
MQSEIDRLNSTILTFEKLMANMSSRHSTEIDRLVLAIDRLLLLDTQPHSNSQQQEVKQVKIRCTQCKIDLPREHFDSKRDGSCYKQCRFCCMIKKPKI